MNRSDRRLGLDRPVSRRDFLNGVGVSVGASLFPGVPAALASEAAGATIYPPAETGMRGAHPGSFETAHAAVQGREWPAGKPEAHYDLVIVGAGLSGLSAAYVYRRDTDPDARILILDNHDDFGGHAKRNEFTLDGRRFVGYGGTMLIESPGTWPAVSRQVLDELGVDTDRGGKFLHDDLFGALGMGRVSYFDRETFGRDYLATGEFGLGDSFGEIPFSAQGRRDLARLFADETDYLAGRDEGERENILRSMSWRAFLERHAGMNEEVLSFVQKWPHGVWSIGADALPAWMAALVGYPGFAGMTPDGSGLDEAPGAESHNFYFPDGNAGVARLLVRELVPDAAPPGPMESVAAARVDYSALDSPGDPVRIRLNSTVVRMAHQGGRLDADVDVVYLRKGEAHTVSAAQVVWAGYHAMVPYVCPDLPPAQRAALGSSVRSPLTYTNVLIRNWRSLAELGIRRAYCPGSFFQTVMFTHPVSMGDYRFSRSPDEPVVLHLQHIPLAPGLPAAEQFRAGRLALLGTSFEIFERALREQLARMLGPGGFDPARDIAAITVNRWPHGYAYSTDPGSGDVAWWPERWPHERRPWVEARQRLGNIAFAGTDAASNAMTESAIEEADRAVRSLRVSRGSASDRS